MRLGRANRPGSDLPVTLSAGPFEEETLRDFPCCIYHRSVKRNFLPDFPDKSISEATQFCTVRLWIVTQRK
jgi:hypothetical protein